jgi:hypothetical protein
MFITFAAQSYSRCYVNERLFLCFNTRREIVWRLTRGESSRSGRFILDDRDEDFQLGGLSSVAKRLQYLSGVAFPPSSSYPVTFLTELCTLVMNTDLKGYILRDITPCSPLEVNGHITSASMVEE